MACLGLISSLALPARVLFIVLWGLGPWSWRLLIWLLPRSSICRLKFWYHWLPNLLILPNKCYLNRIYWIGNDLSLIWYILFYFASLFMDGFFNNLGFLVMNRHNRFEFSIFQLIFYHLSTENYIARFQRQYILNPDCHYQLTCSLNASHAWIFASMETPVSWP